MNGIEANVAELILRIDCVMDKTYDRPVFFCYEEPFLFTRLTERAQILFIRRLPVRIDKQKQVGSEQTSLLPAGRHSGHYHSVKRLQTDHVDPIQFQVCKNPTRRSPRANAAPYARAALIWSEPQPRFHSFLRA